MSIALPASGEARATWRPVTYGGEQEAALGGPSTRIDRVGDRNAFDFVTPLLRPEPDRRIWVSALALAQTQDAIYPIPQPGLVIGAPGAPLVDGASQSGSTLNLKGMAPGYVIRQGQFFSVNHAGRRHAFHATAAATVGSDGKAVVPIWPMLRFLTIDGEGCDFNPAFVEGILTGADKGVSSVRVKAEPISFTITERE